MKTVSVAQTGELATALELIEAEINPRLKTEESRLVSSLLCEEIILRLLHNGNTNVRVTALPGIVPAYEIKSAGDLTDATSSPAWNETDRLESFIRDLLLVKYNGYIDHRLKRGVHVCRVTRRERT